MDKTLIKELIKGVLITPLKQIFHEKGDIFHALKASESSFCNFGEAYFSSIHYSDVKGWKKHRHMVMNIIVPVGSVKFNFVNEESGERDSIIVNVDNYCRLTVGAGLWVAFEGVSKDLNMILNIASMEHDPDEAINVPIQTFELN